MEREDLEMAITNTIENFEMHVNEAFVAKAEALKPTLFHEVVKPTRIVEVVGTVDDAKITSSEDASALPRVILATGGSVVLDFGNHYVGRVSFKVNHHGSPQDAPVLLRVKFGEVLEEIVAKSSEYHGEISGGWIQEEYMHLDVVPTTVNMPRRYAFRYMEVEAVYTSPKFQISLAEVLCTTETSAERPKVEPLPESVPENLRKMDEVALKTMEDCMQLVFEDGPKRDRRLWIGDLRLQALTNYQTFHNTELVKRCLYLFAGLTQNEEHVGACLFLEPELQVDDTSLFDYGLFFISCLSDYYNETDDRETLEELWGTAYRQAELGMRRVGADGVVTDTPDWWCFIDWPPALNKQAAAQGVLIYTLKQALGLAGELEYLEAKAQLTNDLKKVTKGALNVLWDEEQGLFVSGANRQVSWASQVWMVLAGVFDTQRNVELLRHAAEVDPEVKMSTPYMYHHYVDALIQCGLKDEALACMEQYWGSMVADGADCFYEMYDPEDKHFSSYGDYTINSFCHAWSCTPSYFIRKYFA